MARRLLVVTTAPVEGDALREQVRAHTGGEEAEVRVVAPASGLSPLDWLATDEDAERGRAAERAREAGSAVAGEAEVVDVETEVGDADPVQAIEDALRTFPADELVLVTKPDDDAAWLEEGAADEALARFSLPVTHLVVDES